MISINYVLKTGIIIIMISKRIKFVGQLHR